jgi:hypothetical protein
MIILPFYKMQCQLMMLNNVELILQDMGEGVQGIGRGLLKGTPQLLSGGTTNKLANQDGWTLPVFEMRTSRIRL